MDRSDWDERPLVPRREQLTSTPHDLADDRLVADDEFLRVQVGLRDDDVRTASDRSNDVLGHDGLI